MPTGYDYSVVLVIVIAVAVVGGVVIHSSLEADDVTHYQKVRITNGDFDEDVRFVLYISAIPLYNCTLKPGDTLNTELPVPNPQVFTFAVSNGNQSLNIRFTWENSSTGPPDVICIVMTHEGIFWSNPTDTGGGGV